MLYTLENQDMSSGLLDPLESLGIAVLSLQLKSQHYAGSRQEALWGLLATNLVEK